MQRAKFQDTLPEAYRPPFEIRVLNIGGILDDSLELWKRNALPLTLSVLLVLVPLQLAADWLNTLVTAQLAGLAAASDPFMVTMVVRAVPYLMDSFLKAAIVATLFEATFCYYLAHDYMGSHRTVRASFARALSMAFRLIPIHMVFYPIYYGLDMLCMAPGILIYAMFFLRIPVMVLEDGRPVASFSRAVRLLYGYWHVAILAVIVLVTVYLPLDLFTGLGDMPYVGPFVDSTLVNLTDSFEVAVFTVMYFSARCRNEHLDLDLLARDVDIPEGELAAEI